MNIELRDKKAVVTGSTQGIGLAAAKGLAAAGASVVVNGRNGDTVEKIVSQLRSEYPDAEITGYAADLGTEEGCSGLVAAHPDVDILVNNMGIYGPQDFFETPDSDWTRFWEVNVLSGVRLSRAYLQKMAGKGWGRVVFLASESAFNIPADMIHYGVSKTALVSLARGLAKRMAGSGVTVNSVLPGPTLSEGVAEMLQEEMVNTGKTLEEVGTDFVMANRPSSIIRRTATVEEVANMIVYVCSRQASATTGAALRVDGGVVDSL